MVDRLLDPPSAGVATGAACKWTGSVSHSVVNCRIVSGMVAENIRV